jgi:hypothetical protein
MDELGCHMVDWFYGAHALPQEAKGYDKIPPQTFGNGFGDIVSWTDFWFSASIWHGLGLEFSPVDPLKYRAL